MTAPVVSAVAVDSDSMLEGARAAMGDAAAFAALIDGRQGLLSPHDVALAAPAASAIAQLAADLAQVLALPAIRTQARHLGGGDALPEGEPVAGLLGLDIHPTESGPKLIEINTNPGGLLIAAARAGIRLDDWVRTAFLGDWRQARGSGAPGTIAVVDDDPKAQFLYPEFLLYADLFARAGIDAIVCDPAELTFDGSRLRLGDTVIDMVYNRLTDFFLDAAAHQALAQAWRAGATVLSPDPIAHVVLSDKRLLSLLSDAPALEALGTPPDLAARVAACVPATTIGAVDNWQSLWSRRKTLFFKPGKGYAGKAAYRGERLSRATFDALVPDLYVAQDFVAAPRVGVPDEPALKLDLRVFVEGPDIVLTTARLYDGQTTNFRTPGGGFAPVRVERPARAAPERPGTGQTQEARPVPVCLKPV